MARPLPVLLLLVALAALAALVTPAAAAAAAASSSYFVGGNAFWMTDPSASQGNVDATLAAASAVGMRVVRTWAFGDQLPDASGAYSFDPLDYAVASAARNNIRLILALGNSWSYGGPEKFLSGGAAGKTIADFYASPDARSAYRAHIENVVSRYAGNPAVLAFDVINEPRCPGCDGGQLAARNAWLDEMVGAVRASAPSQLVLLASEGFYGPGSPHVSKNPGAGSACEGEDWEVESPKAGASTAHIYWRQVEGSPDLGWQTPGFDAYIPYLSARIDLHEQVSANMGKDLIIEEFGLSSRFFDAEQTKAAIAVVLDRLVASKLKGGKLVGAMIWGLVPPGGAANQAGYNVILDGGAAASNIGLGSGAFGGGGGADGGDASASNATAGGSGGGSGSANAGSANAAPSDNAAASKNKSTGGGSANADSANADSAADSPSNAAAASNTTSTGGGRRLHQSFQDIVEDKLDGFRRGPQRASCADARAGGWTFPYAFGQASGVSAEAVKSAVAGTTISGLFKEAASKL